MGLETASEIFSELTFLLTSTLKGTKSLLKLELQDSARSLTTRAQDQESLLEGGKHFIYICSRALLSLYSIWY